MPGEMATNPYMLMVFGGLAVLAAVLAHLRR